MLTSHYTERGPCARVLAGVEGSASVTGVLEKEVVVHIATCVFECTSFRAAPQVSLRVFPSSL